MYRRMSMPPLIALLTGNLKKTLISMALWLPYLILSTKVNVTFRRRIRARRPEPPHHDGASASRPLQDNRFRLLAPQRDASGQAIGGTGRPSRDSP